MSLQKSSSWRRESKRKRKFDGKAIVGWFWASLPGHDLSIGLFVLMPRGFGLPSLDN
jgi:hypothetical protein